MPNNKPNRLITEKSPYLLQHAYNPVEWFTWSKEAFEKAQLENKPVFVSIGYSSCHWCHVMEQESFVDQEIADILNKYFISIKVDREERPDIDSIYMTVCQMLTGEGGWPLHVFLTPEQKPFYAGTYFPKEQKYGKPGLLELLPRLHNVFQNEFEHIEEISEKLTAALQATEKEMGQDKTLPPSIFETAFKHLSSMFDSQYGGFGKEPKFPSPLNLLFLMRYYDTTKDADALNIVETTLDGIARGGIYDHLGYGFARYSTDEVWLVPHFEKMLYDQALLLMVYTEAYQITRIPQYEEIVYNTVKFLKREMLHPNGAFYSAFDADSEGKEGTYYTWSYHEIMEVLGNVEGLLFAKTYDITEEGNFEGENIPNLIYIDPASILEEFNISEDEWEERIENSRTLLLMQRQSRVSPHLDDKVITSWNALMIAALAKAGAVFTNSPFIELAKDALQFIESHLIREGTLYATYREGETKHIAYLDDYANLLWAFIELYEATGKEKYIEKAKKTAIIITQQFKDEVNGGFYFTSNNAEKLLVREKIVMDQVIPSGNGTVAWQLWKLAKITDDMALLKEAERTVTTFAEEITLYPTSHLSLLIGFMSQNSNGRQIKLSGHPFGDITTLLQTTYRPFDVWSMNDSPQALSVQICQNNICHPPLTEITKIAEALSYESL